MSDRVRIPVTVELLSDAVFSSGFNVPGGEDIAVYTDAKGYPYIKGSSFKGLLRLSMENLCAWKDEGTADVAALFGEEGWDGGLNGAKRRLSFSQLNLKDPPQNAEECFSRRTFTSLESGVVKSQTLRNASCVKSSLVFEGELVCAKGDEDLIKETLKGVKWAGTLRNRGFGRMRVTGGSAAECDGANELPPCGCIRYKLVAEQPLIITDLSKSWGSGYETRGYIPGSALRGIAAGRLAAEMPEWFAEHKAALLSDSTRFLDAMPTSGKFVPLPSINGFYEKKDGTEFKSVLIHDDLASGSKRAALGSFCAIDGDEIAYWKAETDGATRITADANDGDERAMFQTRHICAGQEFVGYIMLDDPDIAETIANALPKTVWIGADRHEGFGKCTLTIEKAEAPDWVNEYGHRNQDEVKNTVYMLAVSPFTMVGETGEPCGLCEKRLADALGVSSIKAERCSTSLTEGGGYNRTWKCYAPAVTMYDRGSVFKLVCAEPPAFEKLRAAELKGIGVRRAEGYGQVLFLPKETFEGIAKKRDLSEKPKHVDSAEALVRRAKYRWVMERADGLHKTGLSKSQLGTVQSICESAKSVGTGDIYEFFRKNSEERRASYAARFEKIKTLVSEVLETPLAKTIGVKECPDSTERRIELLCLLFDHSRKSG